MVEPTPTTESDSGGQVPLGPGWRARRRPFPQLGHLLGAGGGAVIALAPVVFGGDSAAERGGSSTAGVVLCLLAIVLALAGMHFAPGPVASACTSVLAIAIPAFWIFVLWVDSTPSSLTPGLLLIALTYAAAWGIGPARGRAVLLALALLVAWNVALVEISDVDRGLSPTLASGSVLGADPGKLPGVAVAPIWPTRYDAPTSPGIGSQGWRTPSNAPVVVAGFDDYDYDDGYYESDPFYGGGDVTYDYFGPDASDIGWTSLIIGAVYLAGAFLARRRELLGIVTPLLGVGVVAFLSGASVIGIDSEELLVFGIIMVVTGTAVAWLGTRGRHLATSWIGTAAMVVGVLYIIGEAVENSSDAARLFSLLALVAGSIVTGAGWWVAQAMGEVTDGDPDAPPPEPAPVPTAGGVPPAPDQPTAGQRGGVPPVGGDPVGGEPPAPGWWRASDGRWYPPWEQPGT